MAPAFAVQSIAVIGAGPAGRAIAIRCARAGLNVVLEDVMPVKLRRAQDEYAEFAEYAEYADSAERITYFEHTQPGESTNSTGSAEAGQHLPATARPGTLRFALTVEEAVQAADLAIDFVPDELESKLEIFSLLDRMAPPRTILCTPTQTLSVTDLASCTYRPGLCVGLSGPESDLLGGPVQVLRSRFVEQVALEAVVQFLARIGVAGEIAEDREEPMLVKNQAH